MIWGTLTVVAAVAAVFFAMCVFVYMGRLENRTPAAFGETVGAHKDVLAQVRRRESLTPEERVYAQELVDDARSPLAYGMPAVLFCGGVFYIVGCLYELHVHGGNPSFRTFIGGLPMLGSLNMFGQLRRVARLRGRLRDAPVATVSA